MVVDPLAQELGEEFAGVVARPAPHWAAIGATSFGQFAADAVDVGQVGEVTEAAGEVRPQGARSGSDRQWFPGNAHARCGPATAARGTWRPWGDRTRPGCAA